VSPIISCAFLLFGISLDATRRPVTDACRVVVVSCQSLSPASSSLVLPFFHAQYIWPSLIQPFSLHLGSPRLTGGQCNKLWAVYHWRYAFCLSACIRTFCVLRRKAFDLTFCGRCCGPTWTRGAVPLFLLLSHQALFITETIDAHCITVDERVEVVFSDAGLSSFLRE
jgi:hypothetical protein